MRTLYDSIDPSKIPADAEMVAGYVDGRWPTFLGELQSRFPDAVRVAITVTGQNGAHVADCESGDLTPAGAAAWAKIQLGSGYHPTIYTSASNWPAVRAAAAAAGLDPSQVSYWIADYDGVAELPPGAVAKQYRSDTAAELDYSVVADFWPGVDPDPSPEEDSTMATATMTPTGKGTWRLHPDGTVYTAGDAEYYGGYPDLPPAEREGTRSFIGIERLGPNLTDGYVLLADDGSAYRFNAAVWKTLHPAP